MSMTKKQKDDRLALINKVAKEFYARKLREQKREDAFNQKMEEQIRKAEQEDDLGLPSSLDAFSEKNMYWSETQTREYLKGTSYVTSYNSMKKSDEWN
jgi:hypothetical protein